jgi:tetratricopeptide (TPR) repeat protein
LLQQIGEGGMGTVFMAEQTRPVQRKVALKIIKPGMDSRQVVARFEAERQALAMMDHVNIARVFEAGATEAGRPYFVMELVHGVPITRYCDDNRLTPRERLELFVPVCQAIQHAHQKGIIHRDIKPSNVMVTLYDGKPVPKVIDFGVAKATEQKLTERTLFTQYGTMVGTLEYMSPEQAEMSALGADTRSDIFSLGVLLYELLTGSTPLTHKRLKEAAYGEILRMIREEEAPKPSTRLSDSGEALASISAQRHMEPAKLTKLMRGELDWIVMKCLEKDRGRRYETANGLAADVQHYLADEAVQACPPSARYRMRKFVRRNKGPVLAGVALAALLVLGTVGTSIGLAWALREERAATSAAAAEARQRQVAETQRDKAVVAEEKAVAEKQRASEEAAIAQAVNDFVRNDLLAEAAPGKNARNKKVTVEEVLGRAARRVDGKFGKQPWIEAAIRQTIGDAYYELGDYSAAQRHLERALELRHRVLGEEHSDTLQSMTSLAGLYLDQGQIPKAESLYAKALDVSRRVLGDEHRNTLTAMNNLAEVYFAQRQYAKAEPLYVRTLEVRRRVLGEEDPHTLVSANNLGDLYRTQGKLAKAEQLLVPTLEVRRRVLGEEDPDTLTSMNNVAGLYQVQGQYDKAEPLSIKALDVSRRVLGEEHPNTLNTMNTLAALYRAKEQYLKAEPLYVKALEVSRRAHGEENPDAQRYMNNLTDFYLAQGEYAKAEPHLVRLLEIRRRVLGVENSDTLRTMNNLAVVYLGQGQNARAEPHLRECLAVRALKEPDALTTVNTRLMLGGCLFRQKKYAEAEPLLLAGYEEIREREDKIPVGGGISRTQVLERLVQLYVAWDKKEKADEWRKKLEARKEAGKQPEKPKEK